MSRPGVDRLPLDLFGGHVLGGADHEARLREVGRLDGLGDPEVGHLDAAVAGEQDVGRLDVAVDEPGAVGGVERLRHLGGEPGRLPRVDRRGVVEALPQGLPGHELHDDGLGARLRAGVVDGHDAGVGQAGRRHRLLAEPGDEAAVGGEVGVQQLDRHLAAQHLVGALPHLRHPARGDQLLEPVPVGEEPPGLDDARSGRRGGHGRAARRRGDRHSATRLSGPPPARTRGATTARAR